MIRIQITLLGILLLIHVPVIGQITCTVTPADTVICANDSITFHTYVTGIGPFTYLWQKNNTDIPGSDTASFHIASAVISDTGYYRCIVTNGTESDTSNRAHLRMFPPLSIDTLYRTNALGCPGDCKAQFKVHVSGGTQPYIYNWNGGFSQDTMVFGICPGKHKFQVTDSNSCKLIRDYFADVLKLPKVDFSILPNDSVVYLTNPNITVVFPDTAKAYMTNWEWDFGDSTRLANINPATHTYTRSGTYHVSLLFTDLNGCDTIIQHIVQVKIAELKIPNVFTPNGDGANDSFMIQIKGSSDVDYRTAYLGTELIVFDRWGKKVFQKNNYGSGDWDGGNLSDGVYFYILKCKGQWGDDVFRGSVTILRHQ